jgi:2'-5' RNA ligase
MTRRLYTLAYPKLDPHDSAMIDAFRALHDLPYVTVVRPHFTLVFGNSDVADTVYLQHVAAIAAAAKPIPFRLCYAMLGADHENAIAHGFLVPDDGNGALSRLHDRLYSGRLASHLRLDIPYVPHITIGTLVDRRAAKQLCDELNGRGVKISGTVDTLTLSALENVIHDLAAFSLRG